MKQIALACALIALLTGFDRCTGPTEDESLTLAETDIVFKTGTSFGECLGYCRSEVVVEQARAVLTVISTRPEEPNLVAQGTLSPAAWTALVQSADALHRVEAVIGCPDCADGGAEWIEVEDDGAARTVTFECSADVEALRPLLDVLRPLRASLVDKIGRRAPCQGTY